VADWGRGPRRDTRLCHCTARLCRKLIDTSERGSASDDGCVGSRKSCQMMGGILVPWRLCVRSILHVVGDARNTILEERDIEIDKQAQSLVRQPQMRQ
jgi:hypothetical protein